MSETIYKAGQMAEDLGGDKGLRFLLTQREIAEESLSLSETLLGVARSHCRAAEVEKEARIKEVGRAEADLKQINDYIQEYKNE